MWKHRINYKGGDFDYIDSERVPELLKKLQRKQFFMVGENIRDSFQVNSVVKAKEEDYMIYELLKDVDSHTEKKVLEEIEKYTYKLTYWVVRNMIEKYK